MIGEAFKAVLITSAAGSFLTIAIALLSPLTKRIFGFNWHYYIWLAVLVVMLLPVKFNLTHSSDAPAINTQTVYSEKTAESQTDG